VKIPTPTADFLRYRGYRYEVQPATRLKGQMQYGLKPLESRTIELQRNLQDNYDLVVFLLDTGSRYSEAANIPWSAINFDEGTLILFRSKVSNKDRLYMTVLLRVPLQRRYAERRADGRYVFENKAGQERGCCTQAIKKAIDRAGLNAPEM
jgi:integrase